MHHRTIKQRATFQIVPSKSFICPRLRLGEFSFFGQFLSLGPVSSIQHATEVVYLPIITFIFTLLLYNVKSFEDTLMSIKLNLTFSVSNNNNLLLGSSLKVIFRKDLNYRL